MLEPWLLEVVGRSVGCLIGCDFFECSNVIGGWLVGRLVARAVVIGGGWSVC